MEVNIKKLTNFGLIKSPDDPRDYKYSNIFGDTKKLPSKFKLGHHPVREQGDSGVCVGFASAKIQECDGFTRSENDILSPLYLYNKCKEIDGIPAEGTTLRHAMKVLTTEGICAEKLYPYIDSEDTRKLKFPPISDKASKDAIIRKTRGYARLNSLDDVKRAIYNENGVLGGVLVTDSFANTKTGVVGTPNGFMLGLHAIAIIGWDDTKTVEFTDGDGVKTKHKGIIIFINSWGDDWGDKGYGYIPYDFFDLGKLTSYSEVKLVEECWTSFHYEYGDHRDNKDYHKLHNGGEVTPPSPPSPETNPDIISINMQINNPVMKVDSQDITLPAAPTLIKGTTMVPLRAIAEAFSAVIGWDNKNKLVSIQLHKKDIDTKFKNKKGK